VESASSAMPQRKSVERNVMTSNTSFERTLAQ